MSRRTKPMTLAEARVRAQHAHAFLDAAELVDQLGHDAGIPEVGNTIGSLAVLSGIAAADAICGAILGERPSGQAHGEAVELLRRTEPGRRLAPHFRRLIDAKTESQYAATLLTDSRAAELTKAA